MVAVLKTETADDLGALGMVKLGKGTHLIPNGETVMVPCRIHARATSEISALLEPTMDLAWPEGLVVTEQLIRVPSGSSCRVMVTITNTNSKDIRLEGKIVLGQIYSVRSIMTGNIRDDLPSKTHEDQTPTTSQ